MEIKLSQIVSKMKLYIYKKQIFEELLRKIWKELKIFTLCHQFFSFTDDFESTCGRVMKFRATGYLSLLIEVRGKCKYMH